MFQALLCVAIIGISWVVADDARTWTSTDGRSLSATYLSSSTDSVELKRASDGQTFSLPLAKLSEADRKWVGDRASQPPPPGKPIEGAYASMMTGEWAMSEESGLPFALFGGKELDGEKLYPLVVSLHGRSKNNENGKQLTVFTRSFADPDRYAKNPCIVFAPLAYQPYGGEGIGWSSEPGEKALALIEKLIEELPIDEKRVYVVGHSMGGFGTCHFMVQDPKLFTAGVASSGCTGPSSADVLKKEPLWIHHAVDDPVVEVKYSQDLAEAMSRSKVFKYTEYETGGHGIARAVFESDEVHDWLFSQSD